METRGMVVEMDGGAMILHASHQASHNLKWGIALCLERTPMLDVARQMWTQRDRIKRLATGAAAFFKSKPGLMDAQKASLPAMMKANRRDPGRRDVEQPARCCP